MKLVIDRKRWLRGEGGAASYLLRPDDGKMCCMGFLAKALGFTDEQIAGRKRLEYVPGPREEPFWITSDTMYPFYARNDATKTDKQIMSELVSYPISEPVREAELTKLFAARGITVEFVDEASE